MRDEQGLWLERGDGSGKEVLGLPSSSHDPPWSPSSYRFDPYTLHLERLDLSPARADDSAAAGGEEHARRHKRGAAAGEGERQNGRRKRGGAAAQEDVEERQRNGTGASAPHSRGEPTRGGPAPACQVPGCTAQLRSLPEPYYAARSICPLHSSLPCIMLYGVARRFCRPCGAFHKLAEFDGPGGRCLLRSSEGGPPGREAAGAGAAPRDPNGAANSAAPREHGGTPPPSPARQAAARAAAGGPAAAWAAAGAAGPPQRWPPGLEHQPAMPEATWRALSLWLPNGLAQPAGAGPEQEVAAADGGPVPYQQTVQLESISLKARKGGAFGCLPEELLPPVQAQLGSLVPRAAEGMEASIRPGCVQLTIQAMLPVGGDRRCGELLGGRGMLRPRLESLLAAGGPMAALLSGGVGGGPAVLVQATERLAVVEQGRVVLDVVAPQAAPVIEAMWPPAVLVPLPAAALRAGAVLLPAVVAPASAPSVVVWARQPADLASLVLCRQRGRHVALEVHSSGSSSQQQPLQCRRVWPVGLLPGCAELNVQALGLLSAARPLLALPSQAAVDEVCQLARATAASVPAADRAAVVGPAAAGQVVAAAAVDAFLRETGLVVQFTHRAAAAVAAAAEGGAAPPWPAPLRRHVAAAARRLIAATASRRCPALVGLLLEGACADGCSAEDAVAGMDAACPRGATLLHVVAGAGCAATVGVLRAWALSPKGARPPRPEPLPCVDHQAGVRAGDAPAPGVGGADDLLAACFLLFALPLAVHARYHPWRVLALVTSYLAPGLLAACWRGYDAWRAPVVVACRGMQTAVSSVIPAAAVRSLPMRGGAGATAALLLSHPLLLVLPAGVARTMRFLVATRALPQMLSGMAFSLPSLWWVAAVQIGAVALLARTHGSSACAAPGLAHPQDQRALAAALSAPGSAAGAALRRAGLGAVWLPSPAPALGDDAVCCALALWGQVVCGVLVPLAYHACRRGSGAAAARACAALALLAPALWHGAALAARTVHTAA
eukprot:scaffold8.g1653.t1